MADEITPVEIAEHVASLRRLARRLVRDAADADDAVQDTVLAALRSPPRREPTASAWLSAVLRNVVRKTHRARSRRIARELSRPRPPAPERPEERLARSELAGALVEAIRTLPPEKREVVELRYFEGLMPRRIAARLDLPVETIKTRLRRALADLRSELGTRRGARWPALFAVAFGARPRSLPSIVRLAGGVLWMKTSHLVVVGVLLVVAVLVGLVVGPASTRDAAPARTPRGPAVARTAATPAEDAAATGAASRAKSPADTPAGSREVPDGPKVRGRVVFVDADGRETPVEEGTLHLTDWSGHIGSDRKEAFVGGRFEFDRAGGHRIEFGCVDVRGRAALVVEPPDATEVEAGRAVVVRARFVPDTLIRVLDAATGAEISPVRIQRSESEYAGFDHPGSGLEAAGDLVPSPVRIRPTAENMSGSDATWHVCAPGYAWAKVTVVPSRGGTWPVELQPGGTLGLAIAGPALERRARVRIRRKIGRTNEPVAEYRFRRDSALTCDGLAPGEYMARVEVGDWFDVVPLGRVDFAITAGARTDARLEYGAVPVPDAVPFAGEVHIPEGWPVDDLKLTMELLDVPLLGQRTPLLSLSPGNGLEPVEGRSRTWRFDLGRIQPGRYDFGFPAVMFHTGIEVGPAGDENRLVEVPPPVEVRVEVVGDEGGTEPFLDSVSWYMRPTRGVHWWSSQAAKRERREDPFVFRAPAGTIFVCPESEAYHGEQLRVDVTGSAVRATLRVAPICEIRIRVVDGDRPIEWEFDWHRSLEGLDGGRIVSERNEGETVRVMVDRPGRYRLVFPAFEGYRPVPPREIVIGDDRRVDVRVDLVPR